MDPTSTIQDNLTCSMVIPCDPESRSKWTGPIVDAWHGATFSLSIC